MDIIKLNEFGKRYAKAWCSQNPDSVAAFYALDGSLAVNEGVPAVGRQAIADVARGFMSALPDMQVTMEELVHESGGIAFHWTLRGTNTGPGGTGKSVRISGHELWQMDIDGLIGRSDGHFDSVEYERQIQHGLES